MSRSVGKNFESLKGNIRVKEAELARAKYREAALERYLKERFSPKVLKLQKELDAMKSLKFKRLEKKVQVIARKEWETIKELVDVKDEVKHLTIVLADLKASLETRRNSLSVGKKRR